METYNIFEDGDISFKNFFQILFDQIAIIIVISAVFGAAFFAFSYSQEEKFTSKIVITYNTQKNNISSMSSGLGGLSQLAGIDLGSGSSPQEEESYAMLFSRVNLKSFVEGSESIQNYFLEHTNSNSLSNFEPIFSFINKSISLTRSKNTGISNIYFSAFDKEISANFLNQLIFHSNESLRKEAQDASERKVEFLNIESSKNSYRNVQAIFGRMIETEIQNKMMANTQEEYAFKIIDPAVIPLNKSSPRILFSLFLGILIGLIVGVVFAILRKTSV